MLTMAGLALLLYYYTKIRPGYDGEVREHRRQFFAKLFVVTLVIDCAFLWIATVHFQEMLLANRC